MTDEVGIDAEHSLAKLRIGRRNTTTLEDGYRMLSCNQARLLLSYGAIPGTPKRGIPELGFHLAACSECRLIWNAVSPSTAPDRTLRNNVATFGTSLQTPATSQDEHMLAVRLDEVHTSQSLTSSDNPAEIVSSPSQEGAESRVSDLSPPSHSKTISYSSLLQNPNFRVLWLSQAISTFGSYFTRIAVPIYVFTLTESYVQLGIAFFSSLCASLLFGLLAGALVDRWNPRRTIINTDIISSFVLLGLVVSAWLPLPIPVELSCIYIVNFVTALIREIYKPARIRIMTDVVSEQELLTANSLDEATTTFAEFLSYPIAATALSLIGPTIAFGVDAASFLISAVLLQRVYWHSVVTQHNHVNDIWAEIKEGLTIAASLPPVRKIVLLSFVVPLLFSLHNTLLIPYTEEALNSTKEVGFPAMELVYR